MLIPYDDYLDGEEWPSESSTMAGTGSVIETKWVGDMPPQYAASALNKLVKWARDSAVTAQEIAREEDRVRASRLGQLLAARALSIDDFTITEYVQAHGGLPDKQYEYLDTRETARTLAFGMLSTTSPLDAEDVGRLAVHMANWLAQDQGLALTKVNQ